MSNDLTAAEQTTLAKCLRALDRGEELEQCLSRYPQQANALRPYLVLRSNIESIEHPEPPFTAYEAGREALLRRVTEEHARPLVERAGIRWRLNLTGLDSLFASTFGRIESTVGRMAAVAIALFVFGGGALGAAAAGGFEPAQEVLSKPLSIIEPLTKPIIEPIIGPITGGGSSPPAEESQGSGDTGIPPASRSGLPDAQPAGSDCISRDLADLYAELEQVISSDIVCEAESTAAPPAAPTAELDAGATPDESPAEAERPLATEAAPVTLVPSADEPAERTPTPLPTEPSRIDLPLQPTPTPLPEPTRTPEPPEKPTLAPRPTEPERTQEPTRTPEPADDPTLAPRPTEPEPTAEPTRTPTTEPQPTAPAPITEPQPTAPAPTTEPPPTAPAPTAEPQPSAPAPTAEPQPTEPVPTIEPQPTAPVPIIGPPSNFEPI